MTPRGSLEYDPDYGFDVRALLSAALDPACIFALRAQIAAEIEKDERVSAAGVEVDGGRRARRGVPAPQSTRR